MTHAVGPLSRRRMLQTSVASVLAFHEGILGAGAAVGAPPGAACAGVGPRLIELRLLTGVALGTLRRCYEDRLGMRVLAADEREIAFAAGASKLSFARADRAQHQRGAGRGNGEPMYHFAFNIPPDRIRAAEAWLRGRVELIPAPGDIRDREHSNDVWHFRHWNAHSLFFFDPAFNIVELIARHTLPPEELSTARGAAASPAANAGAPFSPAEILCASEIGYVFDDAGREAAARTLAGTFGLKSYPRDTEPAWAMGDERGLVLCLARKGQRWGEHTSTPVTWGEFPVHTVIRAEPREQIALGRPDYVVAS